jgi:hypothetical protein
MPPKYAFETNIFTKNQVKIMVRWKDIVQDEVFYAGIFKIFCSSDSLGDFTEFNNNYITFL